MCRTDLHCPATDRMLISNALEGKGCYGIRRQNRGDSWDNIGALARDMEGIGASGLLFTEAGQVPWMMIAAAAMAAPSLEYSTGIAVAFPRSPMVTAQIAWEMARNTKGKFALGSAAK